MESTTYFKHHNLDKLNWSLLDSELQNRFNPALISEDMKAFSARFLVVPDISKIAREVVNRKRGDIFLNCLPSSVELDIGFMRFVESEISIRSLDLKSILNF
jgi:hypothetical protein